MLFRIEIFPNEIPGRGAASQLRLTVTSPAQPVQCYSGTAKPIPETRMRTILLGSMLLAATCGSAAGHVLVYDAVCERSYSKEASADNSAPKVRPITCDSVVLSYFQNGKVLIQVANKQDAATILGFAGDEWNLDFDPALLVLPVLRLHLPHMGDPTNPQVLNGARGGCFIRGTANLRSLDRIVCTATFEINS